MWSVMVSLLRARVATIVATCSGSLNRLAWRAVLGIWPSLLAWKVVGEAFFSLLVVVR